MQTYGMTKIIQITQFVSPLQISPQKMLLAERTHPNPTILVPPWPFLDDPLTDPDSLPDSPLDFYSSDEFRMFDFKVRRCPRGRSHDWTECPFAHPGEKARRRDPRRFSYSGAPCPEFRKAGGCKKGESCEFAHGVFECWLHPAKYRTQPCKDGTACRRRVCFFAHTADQLRVVSPTRVLDGFPKRGFLVSSPKSTLAMPASPRSDYSSPPVSPSAVAVWFGRLGIGRVPAPAPAVVGEEAESEEVPDFGWVSELVK